MLSPDQREAFRALREVWPEPRIVLIGAGALRMHRRLPRFTADLDVAVAIEAPPYPEPLSTHPAWTRDPRQHQRWRHVSGVELDVLPAGPQLRAHGHVTWPGGHRMSLEGFDALFAAPLALVDAELRVEVASVALIVLLKMVAFLDRPAERARDLDDLGYLLVSYLDESVDDDFDRLLGAIGEGHVEPHTAQAFLLGKDVAQFPEAATIAPRFLGLLSASHLWMLSAMRARGPAALSREEAFERIWASFVMGLAERAERSG
jgi:predicted nucleotidyltransferase